MTDATHSMDFTAIVLAAGQGTRMKSALPKVLHPVAGLPMVLHALDAARAAGAADVAVVVGNEAETVARIVAGHDATAVCHEQTERLGTAHAVLAARPALEAATGPVAILYGDVPLLRAETLANAFASITDGAAVVVLGFETATPHGYGRLLVRDGHLEAIREQKDATPAELKTTFCNSGIILFAANRALSLLDRVGKDNAQGEFYLTDVVEIANADGLDVRAVSVDEAEVMGVNDRVQLAQVEELWQQRRRAEAGRAGVTMQAPHTVFFHHDTRLAEDVTVEPNVVFSGGVSVGQGATIRAFSHLEGASVGANAVVGPYARLRPGTTLGPNTKIGNFVETKAVEVAAGAKINHLSYVGDSTVGANANIGAGTITCNYDGYGKHRTTIGADAFIGSNTALVAPVCVGDGATTAAGSTITEDVPAGDLAIARARQTNLPDRATSLRATLAARKAAAK